MPGVTAAVDPAWRRPRRPLLRSTRAAGPIRCSTRCHRSRARSNGRRDPWPDRARPEGVNGANGTGADLPPRNGTAAFGPDHPGYGAPTDLPGPAGPADLPGRNGADSLGFSGPADLPGRNRADPLGVSGPPDLAGRPDPSDLPGRNGADPLAGPVGRPEPADLPGRNGPPIPSAAPAQATFPAGTDRRIDPAAPARPTCPATADPAIRPASVAPTAPSGAGRIVPAADARGRATCPAATALPADPGGAARARVAGG